MAADAWDDECMGEFSLRRLRYSDERFARAKRIAFAVRLRSNLGDGNSHTLKAPTDEFIRVGERDE